MGEIKLTKEQQEIIEATFKDFKGLKINAYAGTGKTTTLLEIVKAHPTKKFLLLVFNRSVKKEIDTKKKKLGLKNLTVMTLHGLGYSSIFKNVYLNKKKIERLTTKSSEVYNDIVEIIKDKLYSIWGDFLLSIDDINKFIFFIYKIFERLLSSQFIPPFTITQLEKYKFFLGEWRFYIDYYLNQYLKDIKGFNYKLEEKYREEFLIKLIKTINLMWEETKASIENEVMGENIGNLEEEILDLDLRIKEDEKTNNNRRFVRYTHEGYLKLFHYNLWKGKINLKNYDYILVDEAQDVNGLNTGIINTLLSQGKKIIVVGDKHQNIYNWRGAVNLFNYYGDFKEKYLTISFRFENPNIVKYSNAILQGVKKEVKPLKAFKALNKDLKDTWQVEDITSFAYLSRSNAGMFLILNSLRNIEENKGFSESFESFEGRVLKRFLYKDKFYIKLLRPLNEILTPLRKGYFLYTALKKDINKLKELDLPVYLTNAILSLQSLKDYLKNDGSFVRVLEEVKELLTYYEEIDVKNTITIIEKIGMDEFWETYNWVKEKDSRGEIGMNIRKRKGAITLSTIHTSKGLEWDYVILNEDIIPIMEDIKNTILKNGTDLAQLNNPPVLKKVIKEILEGIRKDRNEYRDLIEEINLKYVAITRAKKILQINNIELETELEILAENPAEWEKRAFDYIKERIEKIITFNMR